MRQEYLIDVAGKAFDDPVAVWNARRELKSVEAGSVLGTLERLGFAIGESGWIWKGRARALA